MIKTKELVFVSHPFAKDPKKNFDRVNKICSDLLDFDNVVPVSPLHLFSMYDKDGDREEILRYCKYMIKGVDLVIFYIYNERFSSGQLFELDVATKEGVRVKCVYVGDADGD